MPNFIGRCGELIYKTQLHFSKGETKTAHMLVHIPERQSTLSLSKIESIAKNIALKEWKLKHLEPSLPLHSLKILSLTDQEVEYELNGIKGKHAADEQIATKKEVKVAKCTHLQAIALFQAQWSSRFEQFLTACADALLLLIYSLTKSLFAKPWVDKPLSPAEKLPLFDKMEKRFTASQPEDYSHLMGVFAHTLDSLGIPKKERDQLKDLLIQGEKDGLRIQAARQSSEIAPLSDALAQELMQAFQAASTTMQGPQKILKICDLGYMADGKYHPQPITFILTKDGANPPCLHIRLTEMPTGTAKQVPFTEYQLSLADATYQDQARKVVADLFKVLIPFGMQKGKSEALKTVDFTNPKVFEITTKIVTRASLGGSTAAKKSKAQEQEVFAPLNQQDMITKIIQELGFKKVALPKALEAMQVKAKGDWSKNLLTTLRAAAPDTPLTKSDLLNIECSYLLNYAENLGRFILETNPENEVRNQRLKWLERAQMQLEKKYAAEWGDEQAFDKMWTPVELPEGFKRLRMQTASVKQLTLAERGQVLDNKALKAAAWKAKVPLNHSKLADTLKLQAAPTPPARLTFAPLLSALEEKLEALGHTEVAAEQQKITQEIVKLIGEWTEQTEALFKQGQWDDYLKLQGTFFALLPPPPIQHPLNLTTSQLWAQLKPDECDKMSEQLSHLAHHYWESSLRMNRTEERQDHAFAFVNLQLVQHALIRRKAQLLLETASGHEPELYPNLSKDVDFARLQLPNDDINTVAFAMHNYTGDLSQAEYVLKLHPIYRGGSQPMAETKRAQCMAYIAALPKDPKPFIHDSTRSHADNPSFIVKPPVDFPIYNIKFFEKAETERGQSKPNEGILPPMIIDIRRLNVFGQMLLHPESTLHASFSQNGIAGQLARVDWLVEQFSKAAQGTNLDDAAIVTKAAKASLAENAIALRKMSSPLRLVTHFTATENIEDPCLIVKGSGLYSAQLEYEPTGVLVFDNRNPVHDFNTIGLQESYPKEMLKSGIGTKDAAPQGPGSINDSRNRPRQQETREPLTEMTAWILEHYDPSLRSFDTELNAKLRTLEVLIPNGGKPNPVKNNDPHHYHYVEPDTFEVSKTTFYNAFDILCHRTDCLENETVQRLLEMALYRTGHLRYMVEEHTEYFLNNKIGERLHQAITSAIQKDQKATACFLMRVSLLIKQHAAIIERQHPPHFRALSQLAHEMPDFSSEFQVDAIQKEKKLTARIKWQQWANAPDIDAKEKKYVDLSLLETYIRQVEFMRLEGMTEEEALAKLSQADYAQLVQSYHRMKLTTADTGYPPLQWEIEQQFETKWLPFISRRILADKFKKNEFLARLWYLHETNKADLPASQPDWKAISPYVWDNGGGIQINLLNGVVTEKGVAKGFETTLPSDILAHHPHFKTIIGTELPVVEAYPLTSDGKVVDYIFRKQGRQCVIRYDSSSKEALVMQEIPYKGQLHMARYTIPTQGQALAGNGALLARFGVWLDVQKPTRGFLVLHPDQDVSNPQHIAEVTLKVTNADTLQVVSIQDQQGLNIVQDAKGNLQQLFGFADASDTVVKTKSGFLSDEVTEIHFLSKNLLLRNEGGNWITDGQLKGYFFHNAHPHAVQEFGEDYHEFMLPVTKQNETTGAHETKFLIWPQRLVRVKDEALARSIQPDTHATASSKVPLLSIEMQTGVTSADDQQIQGTSAGYLYIAYALMKQKRYEQALVYLKKAQEASLPANELEIFREICTYFQEDSDTSKRALAVKMKAEVIGMSIWKVQAGRQEYASVEWPQHMARVKNRMAAYESYKQRVEPEEALATRLDPQFYLTPEEKTFFENASIESIQSLILSAKERSHAAPESVEEASSLERGFRGQISKSAADKAMDLLFPYFAKPRGKKPLEQLRANSVSKTWFLKNYTAIYEELVEGAIPSDDYRTLRLKSLTFSGASNDELMALEFLKQILLTTGKSLHGLQPGSKTLSNLQKELTIAPEVYDTIQEAVKLQHIKPGSIKLMIALLVRPFILSPLKNLGWNRFADILQAIFQFLGIYHPLDVQDTMQTARQSLKDFCHVDMDHVFNIPPVQNAQDQEETVGINDTSIEHIKKQLDDPRSPLSPEERNIWRLGLEFMEAEGAKVQEKLDMSLVLSTAVKYNIHLIDQRHQTGKIRAMARNKPPARASNYAQISLEKDLKQFESDQQWLEKISKERFGLDKDKPSHLSLEAWAAELKAKPEQLESFRKLIAEAVKNPVALQATLLTNVNPPKWYLRAICELAAAKVDIPELRADHLTDDLQAIEGKLRGVRREKMKAHYAELAQHAKASYPLTSHADYRAMEQKENTLRGQGIDEYVQDKLKEWEGRPGIIKVSELQPLKVELQTHVKERRKQVQVLRKEAIALIEQLQGHIPELRALCKQIPRVSEQDILNKALDLYEFGRLIPSSLTNAGAKEGCTKLEQTLTQFLYHAAMVQQHHHALNHVSAMERLSGAFQEASALPQSADKEARLKNLHKGWDALSGKIFHTLSETVAFSHRFLDAKGVLTDPQCHRKILVAQWRFGIVYKQEQIDTIKDLVEKDNLCLLRNPGFGKSKAVFPIVIAMMVERHHFAIMLATGELLRIAEQDLDKFSRHVFKQARHIFRFHSSKTLTSAELVDEYERLQAAQEKEGYAITSIESLAALDNTIVRKSREIKDQYLALVKLAKESGGIQNVAKDLNGIGSIAKLLECSKQKHWLQKIRQLVHSKKFVADEVDEIFDINRWINEALETPSDLDKDLLTVIDSTFVSMLAIAERSQNDLLKKLAQSMLHNEQANMTSKQVMDVLEIFVDQLFEQKDPLGLSEKDWSQFKTALAAKKISKEMFVQYIMGKPKASLKMEWEDYPDKTVLKAVSTLKHLCTLTLKTVLKEEAGLDYGLNEDGCTAEPLKKGEKIPFTKHGDEYELIAYHYALYASSPLNFNIFKDEWRRIQSEISAGTAPKEWVDFYINAKVQDKPPRTQVVDLYHLLQQPQHWRERFLLLKDVMIKRVRMFRDQIRNNVQSIILGEDKRICGASGTVNPNALPAELKIDPSCNSRKVSAALDMGFAEMFADKLNTPVEIFDDTEAKGAAANVVADAENLNIQAIINQGGVLKGKNSREAVEFLRVELAKKQIERQIVFVDPATGQIMLWDPEEKAPEKCDNSRLKPGYLCYYGPPDARGVDITIPFGEIIWYSSKTVQEQQRCQSVLRARDFGKGHSHRVRMHKSIQESINFKLGRALDHAVTYAEFFNDIKLRTIEEQANSNWKAANQRIHALSLGTIKDALFAPSEIDESTHWNIDHQNPQNDVWRILSFMAAEVTLFSKFEEEFIKTRRPDFKGDFVPFEEVDAIAELRLQYKKEQEKADSIEEWAGFDGVVEAQDTFKQLIPLLPLHQHTKDYMKAVFEKLKKLPAKVKKAQEAFDEESAKACLRQNVPKSLKEDASAQEQVQQQQQQGMKDPQQRKAAQAKVVAPEYSKEWNDWRDMDGLYAQVTRDDFIVPDRAQSHFQSANAAMGHLAKTSADFGLDNTLQLSKNQMALIESRRWMMGHTMDRVAIWHKGPDIIMQAIDQQDFNLGFRPVIEKAKKSNPHFNLEVHSLGSQGTSQRTAPSDYLEGCGTSIVTIGDDDLKKAYVLKMAQMKLIHGHLFFAKEEADALVKWLRGLTAAQQSNWKTYLCVIHNESRLKNLRGYENSPLKAVLTD